MWAVIRQNFSKEGHLNVTDDILDRKFRNLKKTYMTIKDNNKKTSTGRGRINWEYFDLFEEIFENDQTVNLGRTISSFQLPVNLPPINNDVMGPSTSTNFSTDNHQELPGVSGTSKVSKSTGRNRGKNTALQKIREEHLEIFKKRMQNLTEAVLESNKIQKERNELLKILIRDRNNKED